MEALATQLLNGVTLGALYALVAVGLSLIFGVTEVVNFAHGEFFMLGGFAFYFLYSTGFLPYAAATVLTMVILAAFGLTFHLVVLRQIMNRRFQVQLMATLAASIIIANAAILLWGTTPRQTPTSLSRLIIDVGGFSISAQRILLLGVTVIAFLVLQVFLQRTKLGKAMRAMAQNREACAAVGINPVLVSAVAMAIGAALCGLAGAVISPVFQVFPSMGLLLTLKAFAVVIMGGFGNVRGAFLAAFIIGLAEALTAGYISSDYRETVPFVVLLVVLMVRPYGLFGRKVGI